MWISRCFSYVDYTLLCWRLILNKIKAWWKILISFDEKKFGSPCALMSTWHVPKLVSLVHVVARNILWLPYTFKISVFNFSCSPIANVMKNSSGLWDLEVLWPTWLLKLLGSFDIIELDNYCLSKIESGYRSSNSNSPNGSPWKYLKSYTEIFTLNAYHQSKMWNKWDTKSHILFLYLIVCHAREDHWTICPLCHQAEKETHHEVSQSPGGESNSGTFITDKQRTVWDKMYLQ